ncbi:MAG: hypothetical protein ACR2JY_03075 [Chloroflexota bacterium]
MDVEAAANVIATSSNFENGPSGSGITNNGGTIDARMSYWNSSSGPTVAGNAGGTGEAITGSSVANVNYAGFTCGPVTSAGATPCNATVGGANLALTAGAPGMVSLVWSMLGIQAGYGVLRFTPGGEVLLPTGGALPATASGSTDTSPLPSHDLYATLPVDASGAVLGVSDFLGYLPSLRSASGVPTIFTITLRQTPIATLTWVAPGGQTGYTLYAIPADGSVTRTQTLPATAVSASDNTGGKATIYLLAALSGQTLLGNTDGLLAFPGVATVSAPTRALTAQRATATRTALPVKRAQLRSQVQRVLEQISGPQLRSALEQRLHGNAAHPPKQQQNGPGHVDG